MNKDTKIAIILGSLFVVIILAIIIGLSIENKKITANTISELENQLEEKGRLTLTQEAQLEELAEVTCKDVQIPYDAQEEYTEQEPYSEEICEYVNLQYSKINEGWDYSTCANYDSICYEENWLGICTNEETFCSEKLLSYSADINNQDDEGGNWELEIKFYIDDELYRTKEISNYLYPETTETFTGRYLVQSNNPEGDANQNFGAVAIVKTIPEKQKCEMVTQYKTVTKYRTITKYRTETVCE